MFRQMTKATIIVLGASALLAANGPEEEAAAAAAAERMQEEQRGPNVMICKKFPPPTGTRLRERQICKTKQEWDLMDQDRYDTLDRVQRKPFQE